MPAASNELSPDGNRTIPYRSSHLDLRETFSKRCESVELGRVSRRPEKLELHRGTHCYLAGQETGIELSPHGVSQQPIRPCARVCKLHRQDRSEGSSASSSASDASISSFVMLN